MENNKKQNVKSEVSRKIWLKGRDWFAEFGSSEDALTFLSKKFPFSIRKNGE